MPFPQLGTATWPSLPSSVAGELYRTSRAAGRLLRGSARGGWAVAGSLTLSPGSVLGQAQGRPVLLVHGLGGDASCFGSLEGELNAVGFTTAGINYSRHLPDVARCATAIEQAAARLLAVTGAEVVDVVAHSFGGILLRWVVTHTRLRDRVGLAVTIGTPHRGTPIAFLTPSVLPGLGALARELRPGLPGFPGLADGSHGSTRWVTVAGRMDWVVPPTYAALPPSANVRNLLVPGRGHMQLSRSTECHRIVLDELCAAPSVLDRELLVA